MTARLIWEWMSFVGWLHTAVRKDSRALALFADAEDRADEAGDGTIAAIAASFRGYLARLQGRPSLMATSQAQCSWTRLLRPYSVVAVTSCRTILGANMADEYAWTIRGSQPRNEEERRKRKIFLGYLEALLEPVDM